MRISDWSSDVCSSDLVGVATRGRLAPVIDRYAHRDTGIRVQPPLAPVVSPVFFVPVQGAYDQNSAFHQEQPSTYMLNGIALTIEIVWRLSVIKPPFGVCDKQWSALAPTLAFSPELSCLRRDRKRVV